MPHTEYGGTGRIVRLIQGARASLLTRNITKVYGGDVVSKAFGVGTAVLLIRGLSVADYAAYTAFMTVLGLFPGLVASGINQALVRFAAESFSRTQRRPYRLYLAALALQVALYAVLCAVLVVLGEPVIRVLFGAKPFAVPLRLGLAAGFGALVTAACRSIYQAEEKFGDYIRALWLRQTLVLLCVVGLWAFGLLDFQRAAIALVAAELGVAAVLIRHVFRDFGRRMLLRSMVPGGILLREFFASAGLLLAYCLLLASFEHLDIFMLSHLVDETELANYGVAGRYYAMALMLLVSIHAVLLPRFSRTDMQDSGRQRAFTRRWLKLTAWLIIPIGLLVWAGRPLFLLVNGEQYTRAYYMAAVFAAGVWLSLTFSPLSNVLKARRAFRFLTVMAFAALAANFFGNLLLIPRWGGLGAATITVLSHALVNVASAARVFRSAR
ncbi:MAG: oligosaccharide flippase family protein [Lentisphaerae bacterium]|nr:oligosaccharide flippase family protein [Lentisphaerota bacterium]